MQKTATNGLKIDQMPLFKPFTRFLASVLNKKSSWKPKKLEDHFQSPTEQRNGLQNQTDYAILIIKTIYQLCIGINHPIKIVKMLSKAQKSFECAILSLFTRFFASISNKKPHESPKN